MVIQGYPSFYIIALCFIFMPLHLEAGFDKMYRIDTGEDGTQLCSECKQSIYECQCECDKCQKPFRKVGKGKGKGKSKGKNTAFNEISMEGCCHCHSQESNNLGNQQRHQSEPPCSHKKRQREQTGYDPTMDNFAPDKLSASQSGILTTGKQFFGHRPPAENLIKQVLERYPEIIMFPKMTEILGRCSKDFHLKSKEYEEEWVGFEYSDDEDNTFEEYDEFVWLMARAETIELNIEEPLSEELINIFLYFDVPAARLSASTHALELLNSYTPSIISHDNFSKATAYFSIVTIHNIPRLILAFRNTENTFLFLFLDNSSNIRVFTGTMKSFNKVSSEMPPSFKKPDSEDEGTSTTLPLTLERRVPDVDTLFALASAMIATRQNKPAKTSGSIENSDEPGPSGL